MDAYSGGKKDGYGLGFAAGAAAQKKKYRNIVAGYRDAANRALGMVKRWFGTGRQESPMHVAELSEQDAEIEELGENPAHEGGGVQEMA